jgi:hypothetical protein
MLTKALPVFLAVVTVLSGCAFRRLNVDTLPEAIERPMFADEWKSEFDRDISAELEVSLGDTMFVLTRYRLTTEKLVISAPSGLRPLPTSGQWKITHQYREKYIYTNPNYYRGDIGFMADEDGRLYPQRYFMQVSGGKTGRTWPIDAQVGGLAFSRNVEQKEVWGLRYGGRRGELTEFQIIDRANPTIVQVIQNLGISAEDIKSGFLVKGVLVKVTSEEKRGVVRYLVRDTEQQLQPEKKELLPTESEAPVKKTVT